MLITMLEHHIQRRIGKLSSLFNSAPSTARIGFFVHLKPRAIPT